jgi:signal transduction histidine kinase/CheY-like chemotaxis protein
MTTLLSKEHPITAKGMMEFQPFGKEPDGTTIRDLSGVVIRACVEHLEEYVSRRGEDPAAGRAAVAELVRRLNERIPDPAFRVNEKLLRDPWNSYANEFSAFVSQFCSDISGDPDFQYNMAREKAISPIIQALLRRFSLPQIYKMSMYIAQRYSKNSFYVDAVSISDRWALLRLTFSERTCRHFGPYRRACARLWCAAVRGYFVGVPVIFHGLPPATVTERSCVADGDDYCEWEVVWPTEPGRRFWSRWLRGRHPVMQVEKRERIIEEQARSLDAWHDELQKAYVQQQQLAAELQRRVDHLTTLHDAGLLFTSTLNPDDLVARVLDTIAHKLNYDRVMITFYDPDRQVSYGARILGVSDDVAQLARALEVPVTDPTSIEGRVLLKAEPLLIADVRQVWEQLHPLNQRIAAAANTTSIISVPLKHQERMLGALTVDRTQASSLSEGDLELMVTVANQVAIALDNASAYRKIEELNVSLEAKVRDRTATLEQFLARVSHDLRTPLTSMTGFTENMLAGLTGPLNDKQRQYLTRVLSNGRRLGRLVDDLLDTLVDPDQVELKLQDIRIAELVSETVEQLRPLAVSKNQRLESRCPEQDVTVFADPDKLTRVLTNLIDNAIKYTARDGRVVVEVKLAGPRSVAIAVSDTGEGIEPDALPRLFDRVFRVQRPDKESVSSHRIGLFIVKDLVERHGGTITVESEPGKGSVFTVTLPLRRQPDRKEPGPASGAKRVLIADDDPDIRQMLSDRLTSDGYEVRVACDGSEALSLLAGAAFDGLILDIGMPGVSGLEVLQRIRGAYPPLQIIMITATEARERALNALQAGAQAYLLKPFDADQLKQLVEQWIGLPKTRVER